MIPKTRFDHVDKLLRDEADGVAVEPADALLADAEIDGDPVSILRAARMAGWAHRQAEDPPQALARFSRALAVGARLDLKEARWEYFDVHLCWVSVAQDVPSIASTRLGPVLDAAEALITPELNHWRISLLEARARLALKLGQTQEALDYGSQALQMADSIGVNASGLYWALDRLGGDLVRAGHHEEGAQMLERARPLATRLGGVHLLSLLNNLGRLALKVDDGPKAWRHAKDMVKLARAQRSKELATALGLMVDAARAAAAAGEKGAAEDALSAAEEHLVIARARGITDQRLLYALMDIIDVRVDQGSLEEARVALEEATPIAARLDRATATTTERDHLEERRQRYLAALNR